MGKNTFQDNLTVNGTLIATGNVTFSTLRGSTAASGNLTLTSTSDVTKGKILFGTSAYDEVNNRLGIGNDTPIFPIQVGVTPAVALRPGGNLFGVSTSEGAAVAFCQIVSSNANNDRPILLGSRSRGTLASPLALQLDDTVSSFLSGGYDGTSIQASAAIDFRTDATISAGSVPQCIYFATGTAPANRTYRMQVRSNGNVILQNGGTFTDAGFRLDVNGTARVQGAITSSTGTTSDGTFISGSNATRYTSNTGVNTSAVTVSSTSTTSDVWANHVGGGAISNLYSYFQSSGYIGTRGGLRLGAATGSEVITALTNSWLSIAAGTTARSQIVFATSTAPTSPNNGDFWYDGSKLNLRISTTTNAIITENIPDAINLSVGTTTGTKIGTGTTQKLGFFNATPIVQPVNTVAINDVLVNLGLRASGGVSNFTTNIDISTKDIVTDGTTGTKIGTATSQKLSLWNATPDVQPTTAITAAAFVANSSGILDDTATFGGYTMGQVVAALQRIGALA